MKPHGPAPHTQLPPMRHQPPAADQARSRGIRRATLIAIVTNASLAISQVVVGLFANAFSLVADAAHTLSDLVTDLMVLIAGQQSAHPADLDHPYGHGRIETVTTMVLGVVLATVASASCGARACACRILKPCPHCTLQHC